MVSNKEYLAALAEIESLKRQLAIFQTPYAEKYNNMPVDELYEKLADVSKLPFVEMIFVVTILIPEMTYIMQKMQELQTTSEETDLKNEEVYPDAS